MHPKAIIGKVLARSFFFLLFLCRNYSYISQNHKVSKWEFVLFYFRLVRCIEVNMVVDEWERMNRENSILAEHQRQHVPKLEDMNIHNWQAVAIGALHEAAKSHILSK